MLKEIIFATALILPLPLNGNFSHGLKFGDIYQSGVLKGLPHRGIDFKCPQGTPVYCVADGMVAFVGDYLGDGSRGDYWNGVEVISDDKVWSYFHVRPNPKLPLLSKVVKGQVLGWVAKCPYDYGDHLHLELKVYLDPLKFLQH